MKQVTWHRPTQQELRQGFSKAPNYCAFVARGVLLLPLCLCQTGDVAAAKAARAQSESDLKAADEELKASVLSRVGSLTRAANLLRAVSGIVDFVEVCIMTLSGVISLRK